MLVCGATAKLKRECRKTPHVALPADLTFYMIFVFTALHTVSPSVSAGDRSMSAYRTHFPYREMCGSLAVHLLHSASLLVWTTCLYALYTLFYCSQLILWGAFWKDSNWILMSCQPSCLFWVSAGTIPPPFLHTCSGAPPPFLYTCSECPTPFLSCLFWGPTSFPLCLFWGPTPFPSHLFWGPTPVPLRLFLGPHPLSFTPVLGPHPLSFTPVLRAPCPFLHACSGAHPLSFMPVFSVKSHNWGLNYYWWKHVVQGSAAHLQLIFFLEKEFHANSS